MGKRPPRITELTDLLERGVGDLVERESLEAKLRSGRKLRVKLGIDPTAPDIHLGNAVPLWKLRAFQDAGHSALLILGDFTATIGDPSGQDKTRPMLSNSQVSENIQTYLEQVWKILRPERLEIHRNSEWLAKLSAEDLLKVASRLSVWRLLERDDFQRRKVEGRELGLHELIYSLLQAYDSLAVKADLELGGADQYWNLIVGRELLGKLGLEPQEVLTVRLLIGTDGVRKMSKSFGNYVGITEPPAQMFGKLMRISDELILDYAELCTTMPLEPLKKRLASGENLKDVKADVAAAIVARYHGVNKAKAARREFDRVFREKKLPKMIPEVAASKGDFPDIPSLLLDLGLVASKAEGKRMISQGGVKIDGALLSDPTAPIGVHKGMVVQVGKRRVVRVR